MSDIDEDEAGNRQRVLSNGQVMAFIAAVFPAGE